MTSLYEKDYNRTYYFDIRGIGTAKENTTIHIILGLLNHEDLSGCDIKKRADYMIASFWEIGYGQIYPTLAKLEQEGLVTKRISGESKGPERNLYSIIGAGRETLTQWLKVQEQKEYTKYEILLKLFFGSLVPMEESAKRIDAFKTRHMENLNMIFYNAYLEGAGATVRIIISPAKKMKTDNDIFGSRRLPQFMEETGTLLEYLKALRYEEAKAVWNCNDSIAELNYDRIQHMDLQRNLTPAIFSYEGIQYQYMAPNVLQMEELDYLQKHLRILSGFYGMLQPFDGVVPYRLEMQAKLNGPELNSLYAFWNRKLADQLFAESRVIVNLASKEYSKCISAYAGQGIRFITCVFGQRIGGKVVEKGTLVKMARGEMVRYMAENRITAVEDIKGFDRMDFAYAAELSGKDTLVFIQKSKPAG
ncbi:peroxide stress protein YaaA [Paenibacillus sp. YN15]|uniref:peroxide stress protein YaaA n=1 Tax=Paenibacillus sp. YN15 TaxID=1742774 RepID=UPI0011BDA7E2|nr:peroxide stress protein YaaA [Paenibacillus sp. YN15]